METRALLPAPARADALDPQWGSLEIPAGPASTEMLAMLLRALSADGDRVLVIEDDKGRPDDEWFVKNRSRFSAFIDGDEIYHCLPVSRNLSLDRLEAAKAWATSGYPGNFFLLGESASAALAGAEFQFAPRAADVEAVIVSAYDAQAYIAAL